jgi:iron complex transport system substrate-binding protein
VTRLVAWIGVLVLLAAGAAGSLGTGAALAQTATPAAAAREARLARIDAAIARAQTVAPVLTPVETTDAYRLVRHPLGEARVPLDPARIVTLEPSLTDAVAALGFADRIVGTVQDGDGFHAHVAPLLPPGTARLGFEWEPNLEAVARADPDLILTWDWYPEPVPELARIAPTVVLPYAAYDELVGPTLSDEQYLTWLVREVAAVLGAEERVEPVLQTYRDAVAAGRERLGAAVGDRTVALLDVREDRILLSGYGFDGVSALLYGDLRLRPDPLSEGFAVWEELSPERIPELSADVVLTFADGEAAQARLAGVLDDPLWQRVPAVAAGAVHVVPSGLYYRGDDGPLGAAQVIADVVATLAPDGAG